MSDEDDRPTIVYDGEHDDETPFEAEQRRGRERMITMWRSAVQCVTEAAQREAEARAHAEPVEAEADVAAEQVPEVDTWVFPTKSALAN